MEIERLKINTDNEIEEIRNLYQDYLKDKDEWEGSPWGQHWYVVLGDLLSNGRTPYNPKTEDLILLKHNNYPVAFGFGEMTNDDYCIDSIEVSIKCRDQHLATVLMSTIEKLRNKEASRFKLTNRKSILPDYYEESEEERRKRLERIKKLEEMYKRWGFIEKEGDYFIAKSIKIEMPKSIKIIKDCIGL